MPEHQSEQTGFSQAEELRQLRAEKIGEEVVVGDQVEHIIDVPSPGTYSVRSESGEISRVAADSVGSRDNAERFGRIAELTELARRRGSETPELDAQEEYELEHRNPSL